ncbi:ExbD/TolR family protein [Arcobacter sp. YIC-464]|uniref:ExbD/TolR family protein n=1 Tax=Arcobacter sp. YIC-464 TaxID=3376631 RepID=UPI003C1BB4B0
MYDFNQKPDLNITPLVDIMLVLLAILMVTAPVIEFEEPINLPKGSKSKQVQDFKKINIIITKDRVVKINKGNKVSIKEFPDSFVLFSNGKDQQTPVHIRADKDLVYNDVIFILKSVKEAGFYKVSLVTDG